MMSSWIICLISAQGFHVVEWDLPCGIDYWYCAWLNLEFDLLTFEISCSIFEEFWELVCEDFHGLVNLFLHLSVRDDTFI